MSLSHFHIVDDTGTERLHKLSKVGDIKNMLCQKLGNIPNVRGKQTSRTF